MDGLAPTAAALVVILSAIISLITSMQRRQMVRAGAARAQDLAELSGVFDPRQLQDIFGPPDMGRVWRSVTMQDVRRARRPLGHLISNDLIDWACIGVAIASFFTNYFLMEVALIGALVAQITGWVLAGRLPR